jgi:hypothetical protein
MAWPICLNIVTQEEAECSLGMCSLVHNRLIPVKARLKCLTFWNCCYVTVRSRDIRNTDIAMAKMMKWIKTDYSMYAPFAKHTYLIKGQAPYKRWALMKISLSCPTFWFPLSPLCLLEQIKNVEGTHDTRCKNSTHDNSSQTDFVHTSAESILEHCVHGRSPMSVF